jgi:hypothetical protein
MLSRSLLFVPATLALLLADDALAGKPERARAPLVRPAAAPDADAKGRLDLRSHKAGQDRFSVRAMRVDTALTYEAFLEDAAGSLTFTSIGVLTPSVDDPEAAALKFDQKTGPLPFDVPAVADLAGRELQVQSGGQVYLRGLVPDFPAQGSQRGGAWTKGRAALSQPDPPPDEDAKGRVEVRRKSSHNRDRFVVKVEKVPTSTVVFSVFLDDGLGVLTEVGLMTASLDDPESAMLKVDTKSGAPLPFEVFSVDELSGRALEIRGDDGFTYLTGEVPALD